MAGRIAFYEFKLNTAAGEHLGGTGIYLTSLVNFLKAQRDRVSVRFIPSSRVTASRGACGRRAERYWAYL